MKRLTCAIVVAGALLAADTTTATIIGSTGGGGSGSLDCTNAAASQGVIWPPDHKMVPETITGSLYFFDTSTSATRSRGAAPSDSRDRSAAPA